jgi:hypothetical protein
MTREIECRCDSGCELRGARADDYVERHLVRQQVLEGGREVLFRCPTTGRMWLQDFAPETGGAQTLRLRWLSEAQRPAAVVERMNGISNPVDQLPYVAPDVEFQPYGSERTYRGLDAARRYAHEAAADPAHPKIRGISVVEKGDDAVVLGSVALPRDGQFVEHRPAAWLVTVRNGKVQRILTYDSWGDARDAAGVTDEEAQDARRLGPGFLS